MWKYFSSECIHIIEWKNISIRGLISQDKQNQQTFWFILELTFARLQPILVTSGQICKQFDTPLKGLQIKAILERTEHTSSIKHTEYLNKVVQIQRSFLDMYKNAD